MKYEVESRVVPKDLWELSLHRTYHSVAGVVNIVFTAGMIGLIIRFWTTTGPIYRTLMVIGLLLFPVIQPLCVYLNAMRIVENLPKNVHLVFDDAGIHVRQEKKSEKLSWSRVQRISKERNMLVVYTDRQHGYMLTKRVLGTQYDEFVSFVEAHVRK